LYALNEIEEYLKQKESLVSLVSLYPPSMYLEMYWRNA